MLKKLGIIALCFLCISCASNMQPNAPGMYSTEINAASNGDPRAQNAMGVRYLLGQGVPKDYDKARSLFEKSAAQGNPYAENQLGYMYAAGKGVTQNFETAFQWYQKSANHGLASAQYNLGLMYENGIGTPVNKAKAQELFRRGALAGTGGSLRVPDHRS